MRAVIATFIAVFLAFSPTFTSAEVLSPEAVAKASIECLAKGMYHEARAESVEGIKAVGYVILNRTASPAQFAKTACGVIYQTGQFSDMRSAKVKDWKTYEKVRQIAEQVYADPQSDNTQGATYFHNLHAKPHWGNKMRRTVQIGHQIFYKQVHV